MDDLYNADNNSKGFLGFYILMTEHIGNSLHVFTFCVKVQKHEGLNYVIGFQINTTSTNSNQVVILILLVTY